MLNENNGVSGRLTKRYPMPKRCDCREFVMRELDGNDEIEISLWVERKMSAHPSRENPLAWTTVQRNEEMKRALMEVDGKAVNVDGVPFDEMDEWSERTKKFMRMAFDELNGLEAGEVEKFKAGAQVVLGHAPAERDRRPASTGAPSAV